MIMGISQKGLVHIFSQFLSDLSRLRSKMREKLRLTLVDNCRVTTDLGFTGLRGTHKLMLIKYCIQSMFYEVIQ